MAVSENLQSLPPTYRPSSTTCLMSDLGMTEEHLFALKSEAAAELWDGLLPFQKMVLFGSPMLYHRQTQSIKVTGEFEWATIFTGYWNWR
jgi:hypothetical protein